MQFTDMLKIGDFVDLGMLADITSWLEERKNDRGGFDLNEEPAESLGNPPEEVQIVYIVWALVRSNLSEGIDVQL